MGPIVEPNFLTATTRDDCGGQSDTAHIRPTKQVVFGRCAGYPTSMPVAIKKLDVVVGDLVQIAERRYDIVSDKGGGVTLEPVITKTVDSLLTERGARALRADEFDQQFGQLPSDGEG